MNAFITTNLLSDYTSVRAISQKSLITVTEALSERIFAEISSSRLGSVGFDLLMVVLRGSTAQSAVNTNAFQVSEPGSEKSQTINGFYPTHDGARFNNVSSMSTESATGFTLIFSPSRIT